ncbi:MAG: hypothetical protein ABIS50_12595 [Luteolibacter sp.]|uniref:hypothetical protein n=1 Tax=Luteolibacter sp. TaxID=1962973 RepID=UPI003263E8DE
MNTHQYSITRALAAMAMGATILGSGIGFAQQAENPPGAEVLTRGPVHEAFAGTVSFNPEAGIIVDQAPPALIEEVPPEQRPVGDNVAWIPGYWAWDEDQNDFLWVSGIWRNLPPGREWVPGYWAETEGRHQWTSGYWEDEQAATVSYLPEPPRSVESGPNIVAASDNQTWIPGNWAYRNDRYAWRAGYWVEARENWAWTPAYYRWTHRGYVYVDGYWDYPVARRGVVFAPVHFNRAYISRPDFYYSPLTVIALSVFSNHLFLRPNYGHYYFGDYYEPRYRDRGFFASYSYNSGYRGYDPIYAHYRWENRNDRNWDRHRQEYFEYRRDHADARPPRTWAELNNRSQEDRARGDFGVADRFDRVVGKHGEGDQRFQAVGQKERERFVSQRQEIRKFGKEREQLETTGDRAKGGDNDKGQVTRQKIDRSPVASRKSDRSDKDGGPPERLQPRMSEKDQADEPSGKNGKVAKADREDPAKPKTKENADREGEPRGKGKSEPVEETRTKPGQKREANPNTETTGEPGAKEKSNPAEETRTKPGQKREANPNTETKGEPGAKEKSNPAEETRTKPGQKREANPDTERKETPAPKHEADPTPERKAKPEGNRQDSPTPEHKATPAPKRQAEPTPERKATPAPKPKAEPAPERKPESEKKKAKNPDDNRESSAAPDRKMNHQPVAQHTERKPATQAQPQRQQAPKPEAQVARKNTQPKPTASPTGKKAKPASTSEETKDEEDRKKKQKDG